MDAPETPPKWLTIDEAAAQVRLSRGSLYRLVREGALPAYRIGDTGSLRFRPDAVEGVLKPARPTEETE